MALRKADPLELPEPFQRPEPKLVPNEAPVENFKTTEPSTRPATGNRIWPRPFLRPDKEPEPEHDERGCTVVPIAMKFGRYPCHADFARSISGQSREFRVTTPEGDSVDIDAIDRAGNLYEVKTGYSWLWSRRPDLQPRIEQIRHRFIDQAILQELVASRCGRKLTWVFNERSAARYFNEVQPIPPPVVHRPFDCDHDSDEER